MCRATSVYMQEYVNEHTSPRISARRNGLIWLCCTGESAERKPNKSVQACAQAIAALRLTDFEIH